MVRDDVYRYSPFLEESTDNDTLIDAYIQDVFIRLRSTFGKSDINLPELLDETLYTLEQLQIVAYYTTYDILCWFIKKQSTATETSTGDVIGQDVEEIKTTTGSLKFGQSFTKAEADELLASTKNKLCALSSQVGYTLSICFGNDMQLKNPSAPLKTFRTKPLFKY